MRGSLGSSDTPVLIEHRIAIPAATFAALWDAAPAVRVTLVEVEEDATGTVYVAETGRTLRLRAGA